MDAGDALRRAMKDAFGESSDEDSESPPKNPVEEVDQRSRWTWEPVEEIDGLWLCRHLLSDRHQSSLLSTIDREGWFAQESHNQAMRFGDLPQWATELSRFVREAVCLGEVAPKDGRRLATEGEVVEEPCLLPFDLLWREPFFDQLILNKYNKYEGICAHVDLMRFQDGIAIISLESACVMHFTRSKSESNEDIPMRIPVLLNPGSLVLMSGEARYLWKHEINRKAGFQIWEGKEINQKRRTSITLRKLCEDPR